LIIYQSSNPSFLAGEKTFIAGSDLPLPHLDLGSPLSRQHVPLDKSFVRKHEVMMMWVFPKIGVPQNGWFMMEKPNLNG